MSLSNFNRPWWAGGRLGWLIRGSSIHLAAQPCRDFPQHLIPRAKQIKGMSTALAAQGAAPAVRLLLVLLLLWATFSCQQPRLSDHFCRQTDLSPPKCLLPTASTHRRQSQDSREAGHRPVSWLGIAYLMAHDILTLSHGWASCDKAAKLNAGLDRASL